MVVLDHSTYNVTFGGDYSFWERSYCDVVHVEVKVYNDGDISYAFLGNRNHMLNREHAIWFKEELKEIMTMYKLGGFQSGLKPRSLAEDKHLRLVARSVGRKRERKKS